MDTPTCRPLPVPLPRTEAGAEVAGADVAERERLAALARYGILDTPGEEPFDDLVHLAAQLCGVPTALVSLVDDHRQWFKARVGLDACSTSRDIAFCAHALGGREVLVVPDTALDPRFADNPLVTGPLGFRAYAGAPLVTPEGYVLGTLCVLDTVPRTFCTQQLDALQALARLVVTQLELRRQADALAREVAAREVERAEHRQTRDVLDAVLDHADVVVHAKDLDGRYLLANAALQDRLGRAEGLVGLDDEALFGPVVAARYREQDRSVAEQGHRAVFAETVRRADGSERSVLSTKFPLRDPAGLVYAVAGIATDVTELEAARAELAGSEQRWRALVEQSPVAVAVYGMDDLRFRYANSRAAVLYGAADAGALVGESFAALFPADEQPAFRAQVDRLRAGETLLAAPALIRTRTGEQRDVEVNAGAITWQGVAAVQVEMRDVTARTAAATALAASEERFRALFAQSPVGIVESRVDDRTIAAVNPALLAMLGYEPGELVGRPASLLVDPAGRQRQLEDIDGLARAGVGDDAAYVVERSYLRKDGSVLPVLVHAGVVRDGSGAPARLIASVVDLTDRVAGERALRRTSERLAERQAFTAALLDSVDVGIVACDPDGHLTLFNGAARSWHGLDADPDLDPAELAGSYDLFEADGTTPLRPERVPLLRALREGSVRDQELVIARPGQQPRRVMCSGRRMSGEGGAGAVVAMHDVSVLRQREAALRDSDAFHNAVLAASPDLIFLLDPRSGAVQWSSQSITSVVGYTEQQVVELGASLVPTLVHPEDVSRIHATNTAVRGVQDGQVLQVRYRVRHADGSYRWLARRSTPFRRDEEGRVVQALAVVRDITESVTHEERLTAAALHDPLTGLPNRTLLADRLRLALSRAERSAAEVAVLFCDLDGFKHVNDTAGHAAGDAVLVETAARLRDALRGEDTVARVGGDEFVVLLEPAAPGADDPRAAALAVAARISAALAVPVRFDGTEHVVTVSIGVTFAQAGDDPEESLRDADSAMYRAKTRGKNRHEVYRSGLRTEARRRGHVEQLLRRALEAPAGPGVPVLSLAYQPVLDLAEQRVVGLEALARLTDGEGHPVGPDEFIPVAEDTGLIAPLGRFVLDTACAQLAQWHALSPDHRRLGMAVNVSAVQAGLTDLVAEVRGALATHGVPACCLTIELTESVLLDADPATVTALSHLRAAGVQVSIDDFGTGHSTLRYLHELPVTGLKVDRSFTAGLPHDRGSTTIVRAVAALAAELGLSCVVEGIETDEQLLALPSGVLGQGYLLGRPAPAVDVRALLTGVHLDVPRP